MGPVGISSGDNGGVSKGTLSPPRTPIKKLDSFSDVDGYPSSTIGYDFEDHETRAQLELMDDLQKSGVSKHLDLPRLVVIGEQSAGKSSVLQAVTDIPFPIDDKMCTRFATEIILKRTGPNVPTTIKISIIPDAEETAERKQTLEAWCPDGVDRLAALDKTLMKDIFQQAQEIILNAPAASPGPRSYSRNSNRLSSSTLCITRSGPKETNFAIVDIPGLVREEGKDKREHSTAKNLVQKYLNNKRSIIVVVIDVVDLERHGVFGLISDLPDKESRVIGVINKCDTKQKQSADWVFDLIRNVGPRHSKHYLKEGWYGLRNRAASELHISDEERDKLEDEFFAGAEWKCLNDGRLGRHHLKKALIRMRNNHVKQSIPELIIDIDTKLNECITRIERLGEPRTTATAQYALINKIATNYSRMASGAVDGHYKSLKGEEMYARKLIRDALDAFQVQMQERGFQTPFRKAEQDAELIRSTDLEGWTANFMEVPTYAWIREGVKGFRAMEDGDEVNPDVKAYLWKQQIVSWHKISSEALSAIERTVESVNRALFATACPDKEILRKLLLWLQDDFRAASQDAKDELKHLLDDEKGGLMTLNPLKLTNQVKYRSSRVEAMKQMLIQAYPHMGLPQVAQPAMKVNHIEADLVINSLIHQRPQLFGVLNTHDNLAAHYDIALYRFIDNFALQVVERHLLGPKGPLRLFNSDFVAQRLHGEQNAKALAELAGEDPEVTKERVELEKKRESLEDGRKRVQSFTML